MVTSDIIKSLLEKLRFCRFVISHNCFLCWQAQNIVLLKLFQPVQFNFIKRNTLIKDIRYDYITNGMTVMIFS